MHSGRVTSKRHWKQVPQKVPEHLPGSTTQMHLLNLFQLQRVPMWETTATNAKKTHKKNPLLSVEKEQSASDNLISPYCCSRSVWWVFAATALGATAWERWGWTRWRWPSQRKPFYWAAWQAHASARGKRPGAAEQSLPSVKTHLLALVCFVIRLVDHFRVQNKRFDHMHFLQTTQLQLFVCSAFHCI